MSTTRRSSSHRSLAHAALFFALFVGACGGKTEEAPGQTGSTSSAGTTVTRTTQTTGASDVCVEVRLSTAATACSANADCTLGVSGQVCESSCSCGLTPMNTAAASAIGTQLEADLPAPGLTACPCVDLGEPQCVAGQCVLCGAGAGAGAGAGNSAPGCTTSSPPPSLDGGACVFVDVSTYDTSCNEASDCTRIGQGDICPGDCGDCPTAPVNASERARYEQSIQGVATGECSCPAQGALACLSGKCVACPIGDATCGAADSGAPPVQDAAVCVDIDISTYKTSCHQASDCTLIVSGEVCSGGCMFCGVNAAVSASEQSKYAAAIAPIVMDQDCGCGTQLNADCIEGQCTACGGTSQPAGCPVGG